MTTPLAPAPDFDPAFTTQVWLRLWGALADHWCELTVTGTEHLPSRGPALLVANHGGTVPLDALMLSVAVHRASGRILRPLAASFVFDLPGLADIALRTGAVAAEPHRAHQLLVADQLVGVWPEGFKGLGKNYDQRYRLQRFGRGGAVRLAVRAGVPIIPVAVVGGEDAYPKLGDMPELADALNLPYMPITPTFPALGGWGALPLPARFRVEFLPPRTVAEWAAEEPGVGQRPLDDPVVTFAATERIRRDIQDAVARNVALRGLPWRLGERG